MSGCLDDNPDDARREATGNYSESVSRRADGSGGNNDPGSQRTAVLSDQGTDHPAWSPRSRAWKRGRPCRRKIKEKAVKRIVELAREKYQGFNDHHLTEELKEEEKIELSREKVRRILRSDGIGAPRKRRGLKHRSQRKRRAAEETTLQVDGSPHDWLQG